MRILSVGIVRASYDSCNNAPDRRCLGHKSRTIFDRDNIIHERELLDAGEQLVAYLARQAQTPRGRSYLTDKPCIGVNDGRGIQGCLDGDVLRRQPA